MIKFVKYCYSLLVVMLAFGLLTLLGLCFGYGLDSLISNWISFAILFGSLALGLIIVGRILRSLENKL